jgi:pyrroloquinoline-quinone synthase
MAGAFDCHSSLMETVTRLVSQAAILDNEYFTALRQGGMTRNEFCNTQQQFGFAVGYFSRPMAALTARIPDSGARAALIHNLADEHGFEEHAGRPAAFDPQLAHDRTFLRFLGTLGVTPQEIAGLAERTPVRAFNAGLMGVCVSESVDVALGCLGAIEYVFADISALIGRLVVDRGWVSSDQLVHYKLHAEIDKHHAAEFFESTATAWASGAAGRASVVSGISLGLYLFNRLYVDLYRDAGAVT